jgi:hypothetical protein
MHASPDALLRLEKHAFPDACINLIGVCSSCFAFPPTSVTDPLSLLAGTTSGILATRCAQKVRFGLELPFNSGSPPNPIPYWQEISFTTIMSLSMSCKLCKGGKPNPASQVATNISPRLGIVWMISLARDEM